MSQKKKFKCTGTLSNSHPLSHWWQVSWQRNVQNFFKKPNNYDATHKQGEKETDVVEDKRQANNNDNVYQQAAANGQGQNCLFIFLV